MGAYSYKEVMYRGDFQKAIKPCMESCGATESDYDGDANYDGDAWIVAAFLLEQKDAELASLTARVRELEAENAALRSIASDACGWLICDGVHHGPDEYHQGDDCPVIDKLRARLRAALGDG